MEKIPATVTRASILRAYPCTAGCDRFLAHFGHLDVEEPIPLLDCLQSNSPLEVVWALRAVKQDIRAALPLLAADIAEFVLPIFEQRVPGDDRPRRAIEAARSGGGVAAARVAARAAAARAVAARADAAARSAADADAAEAAYAASRAAYTAQAAADAADAAHAAAYAVAYAAYAAADAAVYAATYAADADADAAAADALAGILRKYFI